MSHSHWNGDYCSSSPPPDLIRNGEIHPIPRIETEYWLNQEIGFSELEWSQLPDFAKPVEVEREQEMDNDSTSG